MGHGWKVCTSILAQLRRLWACYFWSWPKDTSIAPNKFYPMVIPVMKAALVVIGSIPLAVGQLGNLTILGWLNLWWLSGSDFSSAANCKLHLHSRQELMTSICPAFHSIPLHCIALHCIALAARMVATASCLNSHFIFAEKLRFQVGC